MNSTVAVRGNDTGIIHTLIGILIWYETCPFCDPVFCPKNVQPHFFVKKIDDTTIFCHFLVKIIPDSTFLPKNCMTLFCQKIDDLTFCQKNNYPLFCRNANFLINRSPFLSIFLRPPLLCQKIDPLIPQKKSPGEKKSPEKKKVPEKKRSTKKSPREKKVSEKKKSREKSP